MSTNAHPAERQRWLLRRAVLLLILAGAIVQIALSAYYLSVAHAPHPRNLPVGYRSTTAEAAQIQATIEKGELFDARSFDSADTMIAAIKAKDLAALMTRRASTRAASPTSSGPTMASATKATSGPVLPPRSGSRPAENSSIGRRNSIRPSTRSAM
jgi:hypothetical protein